MTLQYLLSISRLLLLIAVVVLPGVALSAEPRMYFQYSEEAFAPGSIFTVRVLVESEDPINAFSGNVSYSADVLELERISTASSVADFWSQNPSIKQEGLITFEGGASEPFEGTEGVLMTLHFNAHSLGTAHVSLENGTGYYADGQGTSIVIPRESIFVSVSSDGVEITDTGGGDTTPPVFEDLSISENPISEKSIVVFRARDDESGISNVRARFRSWLAWTEFRDVRTPIELPEYVWAVEVETVDNSGNTHTEKVVIWSRILKKLGILTAILLVMVWITLYVKRRRKYIV